MTLNIQGLCFLENRQTLILWLNCFQPQIVCLQKTHSISEEEFTDWFSCTNPTTTNTSYKCISSLGTGRSRGVAILYCTEALSKVSSWKDDSGRLVIAEFFCNNLNFQVTSLYGPNNKKDSSFFFGSFYQALDPGLSVLLCGDFNTVVDPCLDCLGCNPRSPWAYNWSPSLCDLTNSFELCNVWHAMHPGVK